MLNFKVHW
jgi:hypothetical protein